MKAAVNATLVPALEEDAFGAPLDIVSILKRSAIVALPEAFAAPGVFTVIGFLIFMRKLYHLMHNEINIERFLISRAIANTVRTYRTTKLTIRFGTAITFTMVFPSRNFMTSASALAAASISEGVAAAGILTRPRSLPIT